MYISTCSKSTHKFFILAATADIEPSRLPPYPKIKINNKVDLFFFFSFDSCLSLKLKRHFLKTELERIQTHAKAISSSVERVG